MTKPSSMTPSMTPRSNPTVTAISRPTPTDTDKHTAWAVTLTLLHGGS